jgi:hypothetical protein
MLQNYYSGDLISFYGEIILDSCLLKMIFIFAGLALTVNGDSCS